jgi:hypothetical protein
LHRLAEIRLNAIMEEYEGLYAEQGLAYSVGTLGVGMTAVPNPRQDMHGLLPTPRWNFQETSNGVPTAEQRYLWALQFFATAMEPVFRQRTSDICSMAGTQLVSVAIKAFGRIEGKLYADHKDEPSPKGASNADMNRCAIHGSADEVMAAFEAASQVLGPPIRVKNNYRGEFDPETTKGYRAILCNYVLDAGVTWGDLLPEASRTWDNLFDMFCHTCDRNNIPYFQMMYRAAKEWMFSPEVAETPARMVVEIQFATSEYFGMRKKTHLWYKILRAEHQVQLCMDFRLLTGVDIEQLHPRRYRGVANPSRW